MLSSRQIRTLTCGRLDFPYASVQWLHSQFVRNIILQRDPPRTPIPGVTAKTTNELRSDFLNFFQSKAHTPVASASTVPTSDPSLLFTSAGMVPFKNIFLGIEPPSHGPMVTTSQRCIRAGGKHNDLDNVGHTARHHTYFEMLGNFSFGGYFKEDAMRFAWEYLTKVVQLPEDRLRISVFETDDESAKLWASITGWTDGEATGKIVRMGAEDNFWQMGETGPCGPCSEIYWDQLAEVDGERYLEIWNLVFMQYDRQADGTLLPLAQPCVDTGMGLERLASVVQGVKNNFDSDAMLAIVNEVARLTPSTGEGIHTLSEEQELAALRVVADHMRAIVALCSDGVTPSSSGRGYVMRRILRRACRYASLLGHQEPVLYKLVPAVVTHSLQHADTDVAERASAIAKLVQVEEVTFLSSMHRGAKVIQDYVAKHSPAPGDAFPPDLAFLLYDTLGFPVDLTELCVRDCGLTLDTDAVAALMDARRAASRKTWVGSGDDNSLVRLGAQWQAAGHTSVFVGYDTLTCTTHVRAVEVNDGMALVCLAESPFYATGGGQVGDVGSLTVTNAFGTVSLPVVNTLKPFEGGNMIVVALPEEYSGQDALALLTSTDGSSVTVTASVDVQARANTAAHHTATHLLHAALVRVLGEESAVRQAGSLVSPSQLRFDFTFPRPLTLAEVQAVEEEVNRVARMSSQVDTALMPLSEAKQRGATALFGEKYKEDEVRVVSVAGESTELCGGTHAANTSFCLPFIILSETGVSAGTRRIEALAGAPASEHLMKQARALRGIAQSVRVHPLAAAEDVCANVEKLKGRLDDAQKQVKALQQQQHQLMMQAAQGDPASDCEWLCMPGWAVEAIDVADCVPILAEKRPCVIVYAVPDSVASNYALFRKVAEDTAAKQYERAAERGHSALVQLFVGENGKGLCFKTVDGVDLSGKKKGKGDGPMDAVSVWKCVETSLSGSKGGGNDTVAQGTFSLWEGACVDNIAKKISECVRVGMEAKKQNI